MNDEINKLRNEIRAAELKLLDEIVDHGTVMDTATIRTMYAQIGRLVARMPHDDTLEKLREESEQLRVQLAGCLTAAEGGTRDPAVQGQYGWSHPYQTVLDLRLNYDSLDALNDKIRKTLLDAMGVVISQENIYAVVQRAAKVIRDAGAAAPSGDTPKVEKRPTSWWYETTLNKIRQKLGAAIGEDRTLGLETLLLDGHEHVLVTGSAVILTDRACALIREQAEQIEELERQVAELTRIPPDSFISDRLPTDPGTMFVNDTGEPPADEPTPLPEAFNPELDAPSLPDPDIADATNPVADPAVVDEVLAANPLPEVPPESEQPEPPPPFVDDDEVKSVLEKEALLARVNALRKRYGDGPMRAIGVIRITGRINPEKLKKVCQAYIDKYPEATGV